MRALIPLALIAAVAGCQKPKPADSEGNAAANPSSWAGPQAPAPVAGEGSLPAGKLDRSHAGETAPATAFEDPNGQATSFAAYRGKPILLNLWATWCGPCVTEMPTLDALAKRDGDRIQILTISQDSDKGDGSARTKVDAFISDHRFERLRPYLDSKMDLMAALQVEVLPTTILYGADGKEVWRMTGIEDWESEDAAKLIAEAR